MNRRATRFFACTLLVAALAASLTASPRPATGTAEGDAGVFGPAAPAKGAGSAKLTPPSGAGSSRLAPTSGARSSRLTPPSGAVRLSDGDEECTIVLLSGRATPDGRPVLMKNRDAASIQNEVCFFEDGRYRYVALTDAGDLSQAWAGVNERGFAILNALSYNIRDGSNGTITNGVLMKWALQNCDSIADFRRLLNDTNWNGRMNPSNIAVMDATGGVSLFEAGHRAYVEFRVDDPGTNPAGFLVRTNFSLSVDTLGADRSRYDRCQSLVQPAVGEGRADVPFLLSTVARDLWCRGIDPYPLPCDDAPPGHPDAGGYVNAYDSINRRSTVSSCVILGVSPGEDPRLSTFFGTLGQPVICPPFPAWPAAGPTAPELDGASSSPVNDIALMRADDIYDRHDTLLNTAKLVNGTTGAHLPRVEWITEWMLAETDAALARWRASGADSADMALAGRRIAAEGYQAYASRARDGTLAVQLAAGPNPAVGSVRFAYEFSEPPPAVWYLEIYDVQGRSVARLEPESGPRLLTGSLFWKGRSSGVYFYRVAGERTSRAERVVFLK